MAILALDPDLFLAAMENDSCEYLLKDIAKKMQNGAYRLALDSDTVEAEFMKLYDQFAGRVGGNAQAIMQIYGPIVKGFRKTVAVDLASDPIHDQISTSTKTLEEFLADNHCQEPVEPELVRMAYRGRKNKLDSVVIVLVGDDIHCSDIHLRSRELSKAMVRVKLERVGIRIQSVTNLVPPIRDVLFKPDVEPSHYHSQNFERAVCIKMHNMFDGQIVDSTPLQQLGLGKQEDIDVYLVKRTENAHKVWIGECRLYKEGNEGEWIEHKKVQQLHERLPKVKNYEESQPDFSGKVEVCGFLISNANLMEKENWLWLVDEMNAHSIQVYFYQAVLEKGWSHPDGKLKIKELRWVESPFYESHQ